MSSGPSKIVMCHYQWSPDKRFLERRRGAPSGAIYVRGRDARSRRGDTHLAWMYRDDDRMATPLDPQLWLNWVFEPSDAGDSTVHASFMLNSYHEPGEMTAAEVAETLETLVRWSE